MSRGEPIVLATGNPHKVAEMRAIFAACGLGVIGFDELDGAGVLVEPHESGRTFEENATIKALGYARQTARVCLADDSGLEVDALGGPPARPGVISSHYATDGRETGLTRAARDQANNTRLLRELEGVPMSARAARFVCVMVLADQHGVRLTRRGTFEGRIGLPGDVPRGDNGFGYDPLFVLADGRTSAELPTAEKNVRSHRAQAARHVAEALTRA